MRFLYNMVMVGIVWKNVKTENKNFQDRFVYNTISNVIDVQ